MREDRKAELEKHVETVNAILRKADGGVLDSSEEGSGAELEEWGGVVDEPPELDHEAEYVDEDRYTTVTVEAMDLSKDGLHRKREEEEGAQAPDDGDGENEMKDSANGAQDKARNGKRIWTKENPEGRKKKKKKFRYESKAERKVTRHKERSGNKAKARARKE